MVRELLCACVLVAALAARAGADPAALPATQAPLRLIGTVVSTPAERSIAVVESAGATSVVRTGDAIGGARVQEIRKDGIVLAHSGRLERLDLATVARNSPATGAQTTVASVSDRGAPGATDGGTRDSDFQHAATARRERAAVRARGARASATPVSAEAGSEQRETVNADQLLVQLSNQARYAPQMDDEGRLRGVTLLDVRPDSTLERLGLRSGDVVVSVAGVRVDNSPRAFDALRALNPRAGGEVLVERRGVPTRISVPPGAL